MRPRELVVRGFRSYADETTFRFDDRGLVGIVGPIGSGKSSILDAIAFALFGKTPRIGSETKTLINQRRDALHVGLTFSAGDMTWKAVRSLRRGGASAHALYRVDEDGDHPVADKAREMAAHIEALLGMDFETFNRSVLLAQGQFAAFLEATGTDRDKVLKGVFGFDHLDLMRAAVKVRLEAIGARLQVLAARRASAESDRAALGARKDALVVAEERAATLEALRRSVDQADGVLREAEGRVAESSARLAELDRLVGLVPDREATASVFDAARRAGEAVVLAEAALQAATDGVVAAVAARDTAVAAAGGRESLERAGDLVGRLQALTAAAVREGEREQAAQEALVRADAAIVTATADRDTAEATAAVATAAAEEAVASEEAAREALHAAHDADRARVLRSGLVAGEPCPVCVQVVERVPSATPGGDIDAAAAALQAAVAGSEAARRRAAECGAVLASAVTALGAAGERREAAVADVAVAASSLAVAERDALAAEVARVIGAGDPDERLAEMRAAVAAAEAAEVVARQAETEARRERDFAGSEQDRGRRELAVIATAISNLAGRLAVDLDPGDGPDALEASLRALRAAWLELRTGTEAAHEQARHAADAARAARGDLLTGAGMARDDDIMEIAIAAGREATALGAEVALLEKNLAELDRLDGDETAALAESALLDRLHTDLRPSGFLGFLLEERRSVLADLAGVHLEILTAGRYRFSPDGEFNILDLTAAEQVRAPESLSGGETFLASLALALALAEIVSREGGRLDAFFLDEGFGSLDAEHLELAMDGIERLVADGRDRLVVVVSHVGALQERFEDLIVLDRDPMTGVTRVVSGNEAVA